MPLGRPRRSSVTAAGGDNRSLPKPTGTKTSCKIPNVPQRDKLTAKIPKSVRFDLEKALVGLCNVWFEEIKPHLLRNNIKVHVHGDAEDSSDAAEDAITQTCSHLDPGAADRPPPRDASYAAYCTTLQTALNERSRRPPALLPCLHRQPSVPPSQAPTNLSRIYEEISEQARAPQCLAPPQQPLDPSGVRSRSRMRREIPPNRPHPQPQPIPPQDLLKLMSLDTVQKPRSLKRKRKLKISHKATQTDEMSIFIPPLLNLQRRPKARSRMKVPSPNRRYSREHKPGPRRPVVPRAKTTASAPLIENEIDAKYFVNEANYNFIRLLGKQSEANVTLQCPSSLYISSRLKKRKSTRINRRTELS